MSLLKSTTGKMKRKRSFINLGLVCGINELHSQFALSTEI